MIEKPRLLFLVIIISFVGVIGLYTYAVSIESKSMSIGDLDSGDVGSMVEVEAHIKDVKAWSSGDLDMVLTDYGSGEILNAKIYANAAGYLNSPEKLTPTRKMAATIKSLFLPEAESVLELLPTIFSSSYKLVIKTTVPLYLLL